MRDAETGRIVVVTPDPWLTKILDYEAFKVSLDLHAAPQAVNATAAKIFADRNAHAFYYCKVPTHCVGYLPALSNVGFDVVDVNLTFEREPDSVRLPTRSDSVVVRNYAATDREAILAIAESCFVHSRFHLDPAFPRAVANTIKREWVDSYMNGRRGEQLLVAEGAGRPAGFLAVLSASSDGKSIRVIDLVGVASQQQGRGIGKSLVGACVNDSSHRCDLLRVGTQAANIPSIRLYEGSGFRLAESAYVLHKHIHAGKAAQ